ncbi:hypothetical protein SKAU_G00402840 [Synaphobranchus kaupii]|uniref:Uncharacterized protein n=1 Tax=Synaphobranchus kaupii TaxID=118154 RepID=A0A9Q1E9D7_SYNKA|nr:hypothetical protein SKAU_G00402840 [Synaphobranchus kaupii]
MLRGRREETKNLERDAHVSPHGWSDSFAGKQKRAGAQALPGGDTVGLASEPDRRRIDRRGVRGNEMEDGIRRAISQRAWREGISVTIHLAALHLAAGT